MKTSFKEANSYIGDQFPKVMYSTIDKIYVLFSETEEGTIIHSENENYPVGMYNRYWIMSSFKDCKGIWTIEQ